MLTASAFKPRLSRTRTQKRPPEKHAPAFLQWLRGRDCAAMATGCCEGRMTAAHVDYAGGKGTSTKVADRHAIPLCEYPATRQHQVGWDTFEAMTWRKVGYALNAAAAYFYAWPGRAAWERKLETGR